MSAASTASSASGETAVGAAPAAAGNLAPAAPAVARAVLAVRWGPLDGRRAALEPGSTLRVGRTAPAALLVPHDRQMSAVHFELAWDGARCRVRDLGTVNGTWLAGRRVDGEADVAHGSWIRAGDTLLVLRIEGASTRPLATRAPEAEAEARRAAALAALDAEPEPLFAVLDAARSPRVLALLGESAEEQRSLYEGTGGHLLAEAAPYLVRLPRGSALLPRLVGEGWEQSFGIYLTSRRPFLEVRRHLRRIQMVNVEGRARPLYFRFYDPRVLRALVPLCNPRQRAELFGDLRAFLVEGERGDVQRFTP